MVDQPGSGVMDGFLAIACIVRPQGRRGGVSATILSDFPSRFKTLRRAFVEQSRQAPVEMAVEDAWFHKGRVVLKFSGVDTISDAERLKGRHVLIPREERVTLPAGRYYWWELEGCRVVVTKDGQPTTIGTVKEVERTGGVDLLHVGEEPQEILIPLARSICKRIDPEKKLIEVDPPEDLLELNAK